MKNIHLISCLAILLLSILPATSSAQTRKEKKEARKEARMLERAIRDSLRLYEYANEEEINVGYGVVKKRNLTTAVSKVAVGKENVTSYSHIGDYLMGRVPGVHVTKSGSSYKYVIRGLNSVNLSSDPLFIVDGVETMSIDYINPQDVQSVEVLKDASASIYGTRGANGVILITTKR